MENLVGPFFPSRPSLCAPTYSKKQNHIVYAIPTYKLTDRVIIRAFSKASLWSIGTTITRVSRIPVIFAFFFSLLFWWWVDKCIRGFDSILLYLNTSFWHDSTLFVTIPNNYLSILIILFYMLHFHIDDIFCYFNAQFGLRILKPIDFLKITISSLYIWKNNFFSFGNNIIWHFKVLKSVTLNLISLFVM